MPRRAARAGLLLLAVLLLCLPAQAQQPGRGNATPEITESQRRLQEIRQERAQLRNELRRIRSQVHDVSAELAVVRRQATVSASLLRELNFQMAQRQKEIDDTQRELAVTQARLGARRALLDRRLRDIYKRGPLQTVQVLLTAESFSDLINRYKYLYLVALRDRALVQEVDELRRQLALRELDLRRGLSDMQFLQTERAQEHAQLSGLEGEQRMTLSGLRAHEASANQRIQELARDERRMTSLIATLETRRREAERRERDRRAAAERARPAGTRPSAPAPPPASASSTLTTADLGALAWPVSGRLLYRFGRAQQPNGTTIRWNGIGIGAAAGSPVRAVESGTVVLAAPFEGYGPTVVLSHGGGYYSLYLYLKEVGVREGAQVAKGAVLGTVGGESTPEGAHLEFQIRAPGGQAVDPLGWLRRQGG